MTKTKARKLLESQRVTVEVMQGVARELVLVVNGVRLTGPKSGPYKVLHKFTVPAQELRAVSLPPCAKCGHDAMEHDGGGPDDPHDAECQHARCRCKRYLPLLDLTT